MEVYGVKPKRFTKEWWGYFWDYYKWHTIAVLGAALVIGYSAVQCATATKYDLQVDYISEQPILVEQQTALTELIKANIDDVHNNDSIDAFVLALNVVETKDTQMNQALQSKVMLEQAFSESFAFILSKKFSDYYAQSEIFEENTLWAGEKSDGGFYVSLENCSTLAEMGMDTSNLYVAVRKLRKDEMKDEIKIAEQANAVKFAQSLIQ